MTTYNRTQHYIKIAAWPDRTVRPEFVGIDHDGSVHVWDDTAGHWTTCHSISARSQARILRAHGVPCPTHQGCQPVDQWRAS